MLEIVEVLGVNWEVGNVVYTYLTGGAWWAWAIDAGFLIAGILTGGVIAAAKEGARIGLRAVIRGMSRQRAIVL